MLDIYNEETIAFKAIPKWCDDNIGIRPSPSAVTRWRLRGVGGWKLDAVKIGGTCYTTIEELKRFFESTNVSDEPKAAGELAKHNQSLSNSDKHTDDFLDSEGF